MATTLCCLHAADDMLVLPTLPTCSMPSPPLWDHQTANQTATNYAICTRHSEQVCVDPCPSDHNVRCWLLLLLTSCRSTGQTDGQMDGQKNTSPKHRCLPLRAASINDYSNTNIWHKVYICTIFFASLLRSQIKILKLLNISLHIHDKVFIATTILKHKSSYCYYCHYH